jgi:signal peptide peptidase SppA
MTTPYSRILRAARSMPWAMLEEHLEAMMGFLELKAAGGTVDPEILATIQANSAAAVVRSAAAARTSASGSISVIPLYGVLSHRAGMMGDISGPRGTSIAQWTAQFNQAVNDPRVSAIVVDCDSCGGSVAGCQELSDVIYAARSRKPITAISNATMASAAYWIGCSATELVCTPSGMVGSIGVFSAHEDDSSALDKQGVKVTVISAGKYKTEANSFAPLGAEARANIQSVVDSYYGLFIKSVARGRGCSVAEVRNGMGQGRMVSAQQAVSLGMCDRVSSLDQVLAKYGVSRGASPTPMDGGRNSALAAEDQRRFARLSRLSLEEARLPDEAAARRDRLRLASIG